MAQQPTKPLALTLGEPAGIGPDITIAAWLKRRELDLPAFYLLGDEALIARRAKALGADVRIASVSAGEAEAAFPEALPVVATGEPASAEPGKPDASSAPAALASIRQAVTDVRDGRAGAVVTKTTAELPEALRKVLDDTPIGHLTAPETTKAGIEMVVLCSRKPTMIDTPKKREVREKMYQEKYEKTQKAYLEELRKAAMIEYRNR